MKRSLYLVGLCVLAGCLDWAPPDVAGDADADSDGDGDADSELPSITGIEGVGPAEAIAPRPEDEAAWEAHTGDRVPAARRISTADPVLLVTGSGLAGITEARAEGEDGQGTIDFEIEETSMSSVRLRFPPALGIAGGLFLLSIVTPLGEANAQVFFLQGERGPAGEGLDCDGTTCRLDQDLVVEGSASISGDLDVVGTGTFAALVADELTVTQSIWLPECPPGYLRDPDREDIVLCVRGRDEMVKVGDFWVDRYESSVWQNSDCTGTQYGDTDDWATVAVGFPYHGSFASPPYACSVTGVTPSRFLTWFQAQAACATSGKRLITNAEWQAAVAGTADPAASSIGAGGTCVTSGSGRNTGGGTRCISYWGAEDMIGNLWEWVADWYGGGIDSTGGSQPDEYFGDGYWNVTSPRHRGPYDATFSAAGARGGGADVGTFAGAFAVALHWSPSNSSSFIGFRCALTFSPRSPE